MHHLSPLPRREPLSLGASEGCQDLVRFFALLRIKPHTPLLVRAPSIPLSFNLAAVLPRWITYCVNSGTEGVRPPTPSNHRLRHGLPGYLILFATHAFVPERQLKPSRPPSPLVFLPISTHFTATPEFRLPLLHSSHAVSNAVCGLSPQFSRLTCLAACAPFTPSKSGQRSLPTYYRGCWHVVSRSFLLSYRTVMLLH